MSFLCVNIFYGALWGIVEATLGYLVHLTNISSTLVLLPIAFFFMRQVYKSTGKVRSILIISIISCGIKLLNLFSDIRLDKVINPAISILLEGCAFAIAVAIVRKIDEKHHVNKAGKFGFILAMNTLWRLAYCVYLLLAPEWIYANSILVSSTKTIDFLLTKNIETSIIIGILFLLEDKIKLPVAKKINPAFALVSLVICIAVTV